MLQIKDIKKVYKTGELTQTALNGVSFNLRENEFVAILGPSGSGKTTLLNIIGGLDKYDSGDLIINGVSTKKYNDRDWDTYRNHTIGFVFQSYNLIPHQSILSNVELALTISGIPKKQRRKMALNALDEVGLKEHAHKKPNQLSGGQMQRVAIARALVNNPDIVLADEPTGALDTKTSVQIMDLLKKVASNRLVVMVTHNPELAEQYATRIIKVKDGELLYDSNPLSEVDKPVSKNEAKTKKKSHMSILTSFSLSLNNLWTKKGRTILTAIAGSIGIAGIALIISLSQGFTDYIDILQEDALSSYPLVLNSETSDIGSTVMNIVNNKLTSNKVEYTGYVDEKVYLSNMFSSMNKNDLKSFMDYMNKNKELVENNVSSISYAYNVTPVIYTVDISNSLAQLNPGTFLSGSSLSQTLSSLAQVSSSSIISSYSSSSVYSEMMEDMDTLNEQYDVVYGKWPSEYDELAIVLSEPDSITDLLVYSLGLRENAELNDIMSDLLLGKEIESNNEAKRFTYEELCDVELKLINESDKYRYDEKLKIFEDMSEDETYMKEVYDNATPLKIVGVICAKPDNENLTLNPGVIYTSNLTKHVIEQANNSDIVSKQLANPTIDVFSGKAFGSNKNKNDEKFGGLDIDYQDYITVDEEKIKEAFTVDSKITSLGDQMNEDSITSIVKASTSTISQDIATTTQQITTLCNNFDPALSKIMISTYIGTYPNDILMGTFENKDVFKESFFISSTYETVLQNSGILTNSGLSKDQVTAMFKDVAINVFDGFCMAASQDPLNTALSQALQIPDEVTRTNTLTSIIESFVDTALTQDTIKDHAAIIMSQLNQVPIGEGMGNTVSQILKPVQDALGEDLASMVSVDKDKFAEAFSVNIDEDELKRIATAYLSNNSNSTYESNLKTLGYQDLSSPSKMSLYFKNFASKENFLQFINDYNLSVEEEKQIKYSDITGVLMSTVKIIVDVVSYILIAFVSVSLIVSSIMVAVITLISVMERTKEIGILRAMGASKHNVSSIFNAETLIIGLLSGTIGVGSTILLNPVINSLIHKYSGIYEINSILPINSAIALVLIAVILNIVAGIIPSKKAAKQDPVIALRSE